MRTWILKRVLVAIPTLLVLLTLTFALVRAAPGGPFDSERSLSPAVERAMATAYHLDEPVHRQYLRYMAAILAGDLGPSFQYPGIRVSDLLAAGFPVSFTLGVNALMLALVLGIGIGFYSAVHQGRWQDRGLMAVAMAGVATPVFVVAPLLVLVVALHWELLPAGGLDAGWRSYVLPVVALALPLAATVARLARASLIEVLSQDFVRAARARGLPETAVILRHALRPALVPIVSWLGPAAAGVMTGSVVVEQIFDLPGIGRFFVQGALNRDYTLVTGVVLLYGMLIVFFNLLVDLAYARLDPRTRLS